MILFLFALLYIPICLGNHLNQPLKISFGDGSYIEHKYRSDGTYYGRFERERIISTVNGGTSTSTSLRSLSLTKTGDFILENTIPKRLYIDGGYIDINFNTNTTSYKYYIYDHQGSVRAVLNSSGTVIQSTDYSAYGVPSTRYQMNADNRFHLGLEWQPMKGLYGYYNNARFRDALLAGTFLQQDPLAEKYYPFSPYHYGMNNPLKYTDKTGEALDLVWDIGNVIYDISQAISSHIQGNHQEAQDYWKDAAFDIGAAIVPGIPAGATKVLKYTDDTVDLNKGISKYSDIPNPKKIGIGKKTTPYQRKQILEKNRRLNNGELRSDGDGRLLNKPTKNIKGQKADLNQAEIDHIIPKSKGGTNENSNLQVLSKEENLKKGNKL